jgi:hypothetical protein
MERTRAGTSPQPVDDGETDLDRAKSPAPSARRRPSSNGSRGPRVHETPKPVSFVVFFLLWARHQRWVVPDLHIRICMWLEECDAPERVLLVFRGAAKSTLYAVYKAWKLYRDRTWRSLIYAADDKLAAKLTRDTLNVLRRHPLCGGMLSTKPGTRSFWVLGATDARNPFDGSGRRLIERHGLAHGRRRLRRHRSSEEHPHRRGAREPAQQDRGLDAHRGAGRAVHLDRHASHTQFDLHRAHRRGRGRAQDPALRARQAIRGHGHRDALPVQLHGRARWPLRARRHRQIRAPPHRGR